MAPKKTASKAAAPAAAPKTKTTAKPAAKAKAAAPAKAKAAAPAKAKAPAPAKAAAKAKAAAPAKAKAAKGSSAPAPVSRAAPAVGSAAPAFSLPADDGSTITLADLRGKNVVLYFYPKDDTPGCTKEACGFRDAAADLAAHKAVVLGVSRDTVAAHARFRAKYGLSFSLLSDPSAEVIAAYGSWGPKKFMGRAFDGILRTTVLIDADGKVKKVYPKVSPETHAQQIVEDLSS
jgi:peroxiredoxin Q/BCP